MAGAGMDERPEECGSPGFIKMLSERTVSVKEVLLDLRVLMASWDIDSAMRILDGVVECAAVDKPLLHKRQWLDLRWSVETQMARSRSTHGTTSSLPATSHSFADADANTATRHTIHTVQAQPVAKMTAEVRDVTKTCDLAMPSQLKEAAAAPEHKSPSRPRNLSSLFRSFRSKSTGATTRFDSIQPMCAERSSKPAKPMVSRFRNHEMGNIFLDRKLSNGSRHGWVAVHEARTKT
eukprot:TRINITY_DN22328_c0_g4_i2.p1 TRINITY_DN22328_c0_g4~~TRINITY_DN22328_c0_g4_i2.p1  ORF type:complete len:236 (-),score=23.72 TRINITY_DN22328_c0_g4_i2:478-1185(-)